MKDKEFNWWADSLKAGDKVLISGNHGESIATVEKVTATQIVAANGRRYRKADGFLIGRDRWNYESIGPATDAAAARVKLREFRSKARYMTERYQNVLTQADCDAIIAVLAPYRQAEQGAK